MSQAASGEPKIITIEPPRVVKCRIPQSIKLKAPLKTTKGTNSYIGDQKTRSELAPRAPVRHFCRPTNERPKSANKAKEEVIGKQSNSLKGTRPDRQLSPKVNTTTPRRGASNFQSQSAKTMRGCITVPVVTQRQNEKKSHLRQELPDQKTINECEEMEIKQLNMVDINQFNMEIDESIGADSDKLIDLKRNWQEKIQLFEAMKSDLGSRQKNVVQIYATLNDMQHKLLNCGQRVNMPPAEDLKFMNVSKLTPQQILKVCSGQIDDGKPTGPITLTTDFNKLHNIPVALIRTCEETIKKRKEIIDWLESKTLEKGMKMQVFKQKINEFTAENEMLSSTLHKMKAEIQKNLTDVIDYLRSGVNEIVSLKLRTEELTYDISELNSQNMDLQKKLQTAENMKSSYNKAKIDEMEKLLKKEQAKRLLVEERAVNAEGQVNVGNERAKQLGAALEEARAQVTTLEENIQNIKEQNRKLQTDFDIELKKLRETMKENTHNLEEIAKAREKLQTEKEELEKKLRDLSENYNESLRIIKHEVSVGKAKLIEAEKRFGDQNKEKIELSTKVESLCAQLVESELRSKDLLKAIQEKDFDLRKQSVYIAELKERKSELEFSVNELDECKSQIKKQNDSIKDMQDNLHSSMKTIESLRNELCKKKDYIIQLENKQKNLEEKLTISVQKMEIYEDQMTFMKKDITKLHQEFGEFENIDMILEMAHNQRLEFIETHKRNEELERQLQNKEEEKEKLEQLIDQKDDMIKMLYEKEEEQSNIINLLRNNLEQRTQSESEIKQNLIERTAEVGSLENTLAKRKQQITQLERIILAQEDQIRKISLQKRKDQDTINSLENKITEFEITLCDSKNSTESPENLDNIIKILEEELGSANNSQERLPLIDTYNIATRSKYIPQNKRNFNNEHNKSLQYTTEPEKMPTKIVMGNFVKKTYVTTNEHNKHIEESLARKKAITNIESPSWGKGGNIKPPTSSPRDCNFQSPLIATHLKENPISRNIEFLVPCQLKDEKKSKMFKFAGHRL